MKLIIYVYVPLRMGTFSPFTYVVCVMCISTSTSFPLVLLLVIFNVRTNVLKQDNFESLVTRGFSDIFNPCGRPFYTFNLRETSVLLIYCLYDAANRRYGGVAYRANCISDSIYNSLLFIRV